MRGLSVSLVISAKPDAVWALVGDLTRHPEWSADALEVTALGSTTFRSSANSHGRVFVADLEVIDSQPERVIEFRAIDRTGTYRHRIELARQGGGTLVTRHFRPERLGFGQWVFVSAVLPVRRRALRQSLERLAELAPPES